MTKGDTMPSLSKDSAPNVQDVGPAVDQGGDLDDITVNFVTIKETHSLAPLLRNGRWRAVTRPGPGLYPSGGE
jgi:hypothetical protein